MTFWEDIKRPFNLLVFALAIIGTVGTFYFYFFPRNERGIAYTAETPSLIYDSRISSPAIHLVDSQNAPITSDTYLQTFTVWNSGAAPIEPTDVRRPMMVMFQGAERILDCKIVNAIDQDVCGFDLSKSNSTGIEISNAVGLTWKHFDPKTGVKFQVIFEQKSKPIALLVGDIIGVSKFQAGIKQRNWENTILEVISGTYLFVLSISAFRNGWRSNNKLKWIPISIGCIGFAMSMYIAWFAISSQLMLIPPI
jgi:hypothetical protein